MLCVYGLNLVGLVIVISFVCAYLLVGLVGCCRSVWIVVLLLLRWCWGLLFAVWPDWFVLCCVLIASGWYVVWFISRCWCFLVLLCLTCYLIVCWVLFGAWLVVLLGCLWLGGSMGLIGWLDCLVCLLLFWGLLFGVWLVVYLDALRLLCLLWAACFMFGICGL